MKDCKRCLLRESAENDTFEAVRSKIDLLSEAEKAEDDLYRKRLEACRTCDHLISGICMKCGCYVEFRAAFRKMKCPNAADRKW
ncbi:MAG: hypothetical protein IJF78_12615 [Clostridia bacterium]|nr:hypothetical protein [Clostridia bacterium]